MACCLWRRALTRWDSSLTHRPICCSCGKRWAVPSERKKTSSSRWIFPNEAGDPEGHFLRKFKRIAYKAGLNCGQCHTSRNEGRYEKTAVEKCCKDFSEGCEKHYLHRLRKTCATFWHTQGISLRTIQYYLGHKSLDTTQHYLGIQDASEIQHQINVPKY